jgi:hypothetical protein
MKTIIPLIILLAFGMIASCHQERKSDDPEVLKKILYYIKGIQPQGKPWTQISGAELRGIEPSSRPPKRNAKAD